MDRTTDLTAGAVCWREIIDAEDWDRIVLALPSSDLRQGWQWGETQRTHGWTPKRVAVFTGDLCVAAVAFAIRRIPIVGGSLLSAPGGPQVSDPANVEAWRGLREATETIARETRAVFCRLTPRLADCDQEHRRAFAVMGFRHLAVDWTTWNAPRISMATDITDTEDTLKRRMRRRHREHVNAAVRRGVTIRRARDLADVQSFHSLLVSSGRQKSLPVRALRYFEELWDRYVRRGAGIILIAEYAGTIVGGMLGVRFGATAYMLYVATPADARRLYQGPLLYWEFIRWARSMGCGLVDWGGIATHYPPRNGDPGYGLYRFKLGFGATLVYALGYYDRPFSTPKYRIFRLLERSIADPAWRIRAKLSTQSKNLAMLDGVRHHVRKFGIHVAQQGLRSTLYWAAFSYLKPNEFKVHARALWNVTDKLVAPGLAYDVWNAERMRAWRRTRTALRPEFFQNELDGDDLLCAVATDGDDVAALMWIYRDGNPSRLLALVRGEAEINYGAVTEKYRGRGIYPTLMSFVALWLAERGVRVLYGVTHATNIPAIRSLEHAGFRELGSIRHFGPYRPKFDLGRFR